MMMKGFEGDAECGLLTIDYNERLKIARFKVRVGRINERLWSTLVQRVRRLGKLIRYQREFIAQIYRTTQEMKNDKTNLFIFKLWPLINGLRVSSLGYCYPLLFILIAYFALETIWSLGTVNWGTASRHHIPATGILLAAAFANLKIKRKRRQR